MLKVVIRLLFCTLSFVVSLGELRAQTIISLSGGGWDLDGVAVQEGAGGIVSWTQTNRFTNVTIAAKVGGLFGTPAVGSGSAFLTRRVGPGTTTNDELASVSFPFPAAATNVVLFTGLTLDPGTWFLTIAGDPGSWGPNWLLSCRSDFAYADGVTLGTGYTFYGSAPYRPAAENFGSDAMFYHFVVIAGTNGVPEERPVTPHDRNRGPVAQEQSFTVRENESISFRFDASDPEGDPFEIAILGSPWMGNLTAKGFGGSLTALRCFPQTEVTYTPWVDDVGNDIIEFAASDHTGHSSNRVLVKVLPPALTISCANGVVQLQWTAKSPAWLVGFASSPDVIDWEPLDVAPVVEGDKLVVRAPASASPRFFRLQRYF